MNEKMEANYENSKLNNEGIINTEAKIVSLYSAITAEELEAILKAEGLHVGKNNLNIALVATFYNGKEVEGIRFEGKKKGVRDIAKLVGMGKSQIAEYINSIEILQKEGLLEKVKEGKLQYSAEKINLIANNAKLWEGKKFEALMKRELNSLKEEVKRNAEEKEAEEKKKAEEKKAEATAKAEANKKEAEEKAEALKAEGKVEVSISFGENKFTVVMDITEAEALLKRKAIKEEGENK